MDGSVRVIDLDGVERNVEGIKWNTTVEEVLCKLYPPSTFRAQQHGRATRVRDKLCMLEVWRGCVAVVDSSKRVSSVLGEWGYLEESEREMVLMVVKKTDLLCRATKQGLQIKSSRRYRCGKVSRNKRTHNSSKYKMGRSKLAMTNCIQSVAKKLAAKTEEVNRLLTPKKPDEIPVVDLTSLPEEQRKEGERLIEAIAEETKEKGEYAKRKKELTDRIASQEKELSEVGENVSSLEAKVLNEKHKLSNLLEVKGLPEIEEILQETARVKSELKVRTKLNRLQTTKMQELTSTLLQVEDELKTCQQDIELLKLSTPL